MEEVVLEDGHNYKSKYSIRNKMDLFPDEAARKFLMNILNFSFLD